MSAGWLEPDRVEDAGGRVDEEVEVLEETKHAKIDDQAGHQQNTADSGAC